MTLKHRAAKLLKRIVLGADDFPQQCPVGMNDPQTEVAVFLDGLGPTRDVTHVHFMASGSPMTIGIRGLNEWDVEVIKRSRLALHFCQQNGGRLLGKIQLTHASSLTRGNEHLHLFRVRHCSNYCMPIPRLWARYLEYAYLRHRAPDVDVPLTASEVHSMIVFYACPRPVVLVSASDGIVGNIFPMNLMGSVGDRLFYFALNSSRAAAALVERSGQVAISDIPIEHAPLAISFGNNHKKASIDWKELPFSTSFSPIFKLPVPSFAMRVRELEIEAAQPSGSHTLFTARIKGDERWSCGLQFFVVHGIYQAWRLKHLCPLVAHPT